jgi:hypothetical protein
VAVAGGEFLLITLRDVPLTDEGICRVLVSVGDNEPTTFALPVEPLYKPSRVEVH